MWISPIVPTAVAAPLATFSIQHRNASYSSSGARSFSHSFAFSQTRRAGKSRVDLLCLFRAKPLLTSGEKKRREIYWKYPKQLLCLCEYRMWIIKRRRKPVFIGHNLNANVVFGGVTSTTSVCLSDSRDRRERTLSNKRKNSEYQVADYHKHFSRCTQITLRKRNRRW